MTDTETLFISVLRDYVKGRSTEISVKSNNEYSEALELAKKHSLRAMYEYVISDNKGAVNAYIALSVQRIFAAEQLLSEIEKQGIKLCVMKGFLIREYYPVPELRSFGDIDFLIEESSAETIIQLMAELGYERTPGEDHVMSFKKDKEYYEFHTKLIEKGVFNDETYKTASFAWDYTVPYNDYKNIFEFTREFHLFYTVLHIAKHFRSMGAGVRMILDVAVLTDRADDIDWNKLFEFFDNCGMSRFARTVFYICALWFDTELPETVKSDSLESEVYDELCRFILNGGTFGFCERSFAAAELRREMSSGDSEEKNSDDEGRRAQFKTVMRFFFPTYKQMCRKYDFCRKSKLILPVAYAVRFFEGIGKPAKKKRALSRIKGISGDRDIAVKEYEMYKLCGLDFLR